jgi:hypothetical protein
LAEGEDMGLGMGEEVGLGSELGSGVGLAEAIGLGALDGFEEGRTLGFGEGLNEAAALRAGFMDWSLSASQPEPKRLVATIAVTYPD